MRVRSVLAVSVVLAFGILPGPAEGAPADLDPSFGTGGKVTTDLGPGPNSASAIAIQADGKIVAVGRSGSGDFAVVRYNTDGSLDNTFSLDGKVTTTLGNGSGVDEAHAVTIQGDGRIVVAGVANNFITFDDFAVVRYNADGSLDTTFGGDGIVLVDNNFDVAWAVAIQGDGKIVVAGRTGAVPDSMVVRFNVNGTLDSTFNDESPFTAPGIVVTVIGTGLSDDQFHGLALQGDGKIVAVGFVEAGTNNNDFTVARYNTNGSLDTTFNGDGMLTTDFGGLDEAEDIAIQGDGKVVAIGHSGSGLFALARYNADGSLDPTFDGDGKVTTSFGGEARAFALGIQADGKIVAAGFSVFNSNQDFALARYQSNGTLDASFGTGGKVTTGFGEPSTDLGQDVVIQADGRIVVAGGAGPCTPPCRFALARFLGGTVIVLQVQIDVKPGSNPNIISLRKDRRLPVAILGSASFSPTQIDPNTIMISNVTVRSRGPAKKSKLSYSLEDSNADGFLDAVAVFEVRDLVSAGVLSGNTTALTLEAKLLDGTTIQGTDAVSVVQ